MQYEYITIKKFWHINVSIARDQRRRCAYTRSSTQGNYSMSRRTPLDATRAEQGRQQGTRCCATATISLAPRGPRALELEFEPEPEPERMRARGRLFPAPGHMPFDRAPGQAMKPSVRPCLSVSASETDELVVPLAGRISGPVHGDVKASTAGTVTRRFYI
jgi:hypothetical protein